MTKLSVFLAAFLFSSVALADDDQQFNQDMPEGGGNGGQGAVAEVQVKPAPKTTSYFVYRSKHNLAITRPNGEDIQHSSLKPYFGWEGGASSFTGTFGPGDMMTLYWKLDIRGPYWLYVTYTQTSCGVSLEVDHSNNHEWQDCRAAANFDELMKDRHDEMVNLLGYVLLRVGQDSWSRDVEEIKAYNFGMYTPTEADKIECQKWIDQLNSDAWPLREQATRKLMEMPNVATFETLIKDVELAPEQQARIGSVRHRMKLGMDDNLYLSFIHDIGVID